MQTIYQMIGLVREVERQGGVPADPAEYKRRYVGLLMNHIRGRLEALRRGAMKPEQMLVPGARELLKNLKARGVKLCLASGTDEDFVKEEAELLGVADCFDGRIYGAVADYRAFSKAMVIDRILSENEIDGTQLLGFGDGYVEIDNTKCAGGTGVGVATDETGRSGAANALKRERLLGVGADIVVPDFKDGETLVGYLMGDVRPGT
jgi:phosphoglycolate phosphatase-like HAD superfamily hydrolase